MNMLPSVPDSLVDQFWTVYKLLHDGTEVSSGAYKAFYVSNEGTRTCLLCDHTIQNVTQMNQHLEGLHFEWFRHKCEYKEWQVSFRR